MTDDLHQTRDSILAKLEPRMRGPKFRRDMSRGPEAFLDSAETLTQGARNMDHLRDMAYQIWPKLRISVNTKVEWTVSLVTVMPSGEPVDWFVVEVPK